MGAKRSIAVISRAADLFILFVVGPMVGLVCVVGGLGIAYRLIHERRFDFAPAIVSLALLLIGLGLFQFAYLVRFNTRAHLGTSIIYVASVGFIVIGATVLGISIFGGSTLRYIHGLWAGPGVIAIGIYGFRFARSRTIRNHVPDPTLSSGTPPAGQESRHR
jgi:flagellar biosynthesis protein FliQ